MAVYVSTVSPYLKRANYFCFKQGSDYKKITMFSVQEREGKEAKNGGKRLSENVNASAQTRNNDDMN